MGACRARLTELDPVLTCAGAVRLLSRPSNTSPFALSDRWCRGSRALPVVAIPAITSVTASPASQIRRVIDPSADPAVRATARTCLRVSAGRAVSPESHRVGPAEDFQEAREGDTVHHRTAQEAVRRPACRAVAGDRASRRTMRSSFGRAATDAASEPVSWEGMMADDIVHHRSDPLLDGALERFERAEAELEETEERRRRLHRRGRESGRRARIDARRGDQEVDRRP